MFLPCRRAVEASAGMNAEPQRPNRSGHAVNEGPEARREQGIQKESKRTGIILDGRPREP